MNKGKFIYKMFDKRGAFNFHFVRMPSVSSNIPSITFYSFTIQNITYSKKTIKWNGKSRRFKINLSKQIFQKYHILALDIAIKTAAT